MIDFYTWTTPNGRKVSIMLEECGLEYTTHSINITEGDQRGEAFTAVSPNQKIPAIHDHETGIQKADVVVAVGEAVGGLQRHPQVTLLIGRGAGIVSDLGDECRLG